MKYNLHKLVANDNADLSYLPYKCTGTATAYNVHGCSFLLRFSLSNVDYQDIHTSLNTQVIMTGKVKEDDKGNSPRKRKPGDSPLLRGMCVGIAISMNTSNVMWLQH